MEVLGHTQQRLGMMTCLHPDGFHWYSLGYYQGWELAGLLAPPPGPCQLTYETVPVRPRDIYIAFVPVSAQEVTTQ